MNKPFTVGDLRVLLAPLSLIRRKAIMYCLETRTMPVELLHLRWQGVFKRHLPTLARDIVRSLPRHLNLQYVFWEYVPGAGGVAGPLFGLEDTVREVTAGRDYIALQRLYDRMVWVDELAEAASFGMKLDGITRD